MKIFYNKLKQRHNNKKKKNKWKIVSYQKFDKYCQYFSHISKRWKIFYSSIIYINSNLKIVSKFLLYSCKYLCQKYTIINVFIHTFYVIVCIMERENILKSRDYTKYILYIWENAVNIGGAKLVYPILLLRYPFFLCILYDISWEL